MRTLQESQDDFLREQGFDLTVLLNRPVTLTESEPTTLEREDGWNKPESERPKVCVTYCEKPVGTGPGECDYFLNR